jgi:WD40 repeat protein
MEWDAERPLPGPAENEAAPPAYAFRGDRLRLAGAQPRGNSFVVRAQDGETGEDLFTSKTFKEVSIVWGVVLSQDGSRLAVSFERDRPGQPTVLTVWDADSGKELMSRESKGYAPVWAATFSRDGRQLAWADNAGLHIWDGGTTRQLSEGPTYINDLVLSPDGRHLAVSTTREVQILDVAAGRVVRTLGGKWNYVGCLCYAPEGTRLASRVRTDYHGPEEVKVWDVTTGQELQSLKGSWRIGSVVFSPDSGRIASLGWNRNDPSRAADVKVWEVATGLALLRLDCHGAVREGRLGFDPEGARLFLFDRLPSGPAATHRFGQVWDGRPLPPDKQNVGRAS